MTKQINTGTEQYHLAIFRDAVNMKPHVPLYTSHVAPAKIIQKVISKAVGVSTQTVRRIFDVEDISRIFSLHPLIPEHPGIYSCILAFDLKRCLWGNGIDDKVIVAVWAVFIAINFVNVGSSVCFRFVPLLELLRIFAKTLLALFTGEGHVKFL